MTENWFDKRRVERADDVLAATQLGGMRLAPGGPPLSFSPMPVPHRFPSCRWIAWLVAIYSVWLWLSAQTATNEVPFEAGFIPADAVAESANPYLYLADTARQRVVRMNLRTGYIDRGIGFDHQVKCLSLTPDEHRLFVALAPDPNTVTPDEPKGYVAEIDLESGGKLREVPIDVEPQDLAATDDGLLVVTGAVAGGNSLTIHQSSSGLRLGTGRNMLSSSRLALSGDQRGVYHVNADQGFWEYLHHRFDSNGTFTNWWNYTEHEVGRPFPHPDAQRIVSSSGSILTASASQLVDLKPVGALSVGRFHSLAFDVRNRGFHVIQFLGDLTSYNGDTLEVVGTESVAATVFKLMVSDGLVTVLEQNGKVHIRENLLVGNASNLPPVAAFTWSPAVPTSEQWVRFDPQSSVDDADKVTDLSVRWDWDGDGRFDTAFGPLAEARQRFRRFGPQVVVAQVKDRFGAIGSVTNRFEVLQEIDPGVAVTNSVPGRLPFRPADVVFDPQRPHLFASDSSGRRLVRMNLTNGLVEREFRFETPAGPLAIEAGGNRLFVGMVEEPTGGVGTPTTGFVAELDLESGTKLREFPVDIAPTDMVASVTKWLVISGTWQNGAGLKSYPTGILPYPSKALALDNWSRLALDFNQSLIAASPGTRVRLGALGELVNRGDSIPMGGACWVVKQGRLVVTALGTLYSPTMGYLGKLAAGVDDVLSLDQREQLVTISGGALKAYSLTGFSPQGCPRVPPGATALGHWDGRLYVVCMSQDGATLHSVGYPSRNLEENLPPRVRITIPAPPGGVAAGGGLITAAEALDADGYVTQVEYLVNGLPVAGKATEPPWQLGIPVQSVGERILTAIATDNWGVRATSAPVVVHATVAPEVSLSAQVLDTDELARVELTAVAVDSDGQVKEVVFFSEETELGRSSEPPFRFVVEGVVRGLRNFSAVAVDDWGVRSLPAGLRVGVNLYPGDYVTNRIVLAGTDVTVMARNDDATTEPFEPLFGFGLPNHSLWWEWAPPLNMAGTMLVDVDGSSFSPLVGILRLGRDGIPERLGNNGVGPVAVASRVKWPVSASQFPYPHLITVASLGQQTGEIRLRVRWFPGNFSPGTHSGNNAFSQSLELPGIRGETLTYNNDATSETREPAHAGNTARRSLWWKWTAPARGRLSLNTVGSSFDTVLAVYTGTNVQKLLRVASNDDASSDTLTSAADLPVVAGATYRIAVDGFQGETGQIWLRHEFIGHVGVTLVEQPEERYDLRVDATVHPKVIIERSADLKTWLPVRTNVVTGGTVVFPMNLPNESGAAFFRVWAAE